MIKRLSSVLLALSLSATTLAIIPEKNRTVFLWDLHHVLLKPKGRVQAFRQYPHKKEALQNANLRRKFFKYILISPFKEVTSEKFFELADRYDNPYFKELILKVTTAQEPMEKTVEVLQELKEKGYTHHVGSNMDFTTFKIITDPQKYPQFAHVFKHFDLAHSQVITREMGVKKPNPAFFKRYLTKNNLDPQTTRIIFIDDLTKNVRTANALGLEGVRFKNATQLRRDLAKMGIDVNQ